jgi:hypothetical protein
MGYQLPHACPHPAAPPTALEIDQLHDSQAGEGRHRCPACAYDAGFQAGTAHMARDRRRRTWELQGPVEVCENGHAAPITTLETIPPTQGLHRWSCPVCAWSLGWRDAVASR